jgi:hypothetical protein
MGEILGHLVVAGFKPGGLTRSRRSSFRGWSIRGLAFETSAISQFEHASLKR